MKIQNLLKKYRDKTVVSNVSFDIPKQKITALIGPNGAGKSTVMSIISRLIATTEGSVELEGKEIHQWDNKELAKKLSILSQSNHTNMKLTVEELVAFGRFPHSSGRHSQEDLRKIQQAIHYMELDEQKSQFLDELSGGQRQRAYIAMVIAQDTEYILLDEPTNNLDIYHASKLMQTLRKLCDDLGKTIVIVLHDLNFAAFYSDYIAAFKNGEIAKFGTVQEVMTKENLQNIYNIAFDVMNIEGKPLSIYY